MFDFPDTPLPRRTSTPIADNKSQLEPLRFIMHMKQDSGIADLAEIRHKISNGDYLTREAAEESAQRFLDNGDLD